MSLLLPLSRHYTTLDTTEIIPIKHGVAGKHYMGGNLKQRRRSFGLVAIGGAQTNVLAIGGMRSQYGNSELYDTEEWDKVGKIWKPYTKTLDPQYKGQAYLAVSPELVCN